VVSAFDNRVRTDYQTPLKAMSDFVNRFLEVGASTAKEVWLVKALLDLIESDQSIDDGQAFYVSESGQAMTKATLRGMVDFCFQSFLLGVWHYIVVNKQDNKSGKATYDFWCPSRGRAERKYTGNMGEGIKRTINVTVPTDANLEKNDGNAADTEDEPTVKYGEPHAEETTDGTSAKATHQVVNTPFVFNQYGNNNIQIGSIDKLTINNG